MILGPDLTAMRDRAKVQVMTFFVRLAEQDGTPPTLRALYVMKAAQAEVVLAGGSSPLIEDEAALRGWTPYQMARVVAQMAADSGALEIERMRANVAVENATNEDQIVEILKNIDIIFTLDLDK